MIYSCRVINFFKYLTTLLLYFRPKLWVWKDREPGHLEAIYVYPSGTRSEIFSRANCECGCTCDFAQGRRSIAWEWKEGGRGRGWRDISVEGSIYLTYPYFARCTRWVEVRENGGQLSDSDARAIPRQKPTFSISQQIPNFSPRKTFMIVWLF